jgi:predicted O-linked N-acetylglucosamine transferase (SPINDLY family)
VIVGMSDEQAAQNIYADDIDILVDLSGHTSGNRLALFAWKPAPVQVSWLGYFASTGVPGIDFLLTDAISVTESQSQYFSEKFWYLPETRLCFTQPDTALMPSSVPAKENHYITFGCFQNLSKINNEVIKVWSLIFEALPTAKLVIRNKQMTCLDEQKNLLQRLISVGIQSERITIEQPLAREDYLASYSKIDILLDTFPYPGGTTTCEALWMGVPTLTLFGDTLLARQGASIFNCAGLQEWIAKDEDEYVAKAVQYATNIEQLVEIRTKLRPQLLETALFNAVRFSEQLEEAMSGMWKQRLSEENCT